MPAGPSSEGEAVNAKAAAEGLPSVEPVVTGLDVLVVVAGHTACYFANSIFIRQKSESVTADRDDGT